MAFTGAKFCKNATVKNFERINGLKTSKELQRIPWGEYTLFFEDLWGECTLIRGVLGEHNLILRS